MEDDFHFGDYMMRPLAEKELKMVFDWRNSARIHEMMLTDHIILWEEHSAWFERVKLQKPCRNFMFIYRGIPIGYIAYAQFDPERKFCSPGAYIGDTIKADLVSGLVLMFMTVEYAFSVLGMEVLETPVFAKNKRALGIDRFIGYSEVMGKEEEYQKAGVTEEALLMRLERQEWLKQKNKILNTIGKC